MHKFIHMVAGMLAWKEFEKHVSNSVPPHPEYFIQFDKVTKGFSFSFQQLNILLLLFSTYPC